MVRPLLRHLIFLSSVLVAARPSAALSSSSSSSSSPQPHPSPPPSFPFRRFSFAPNGVCVKPKTFYDGGDAGRGQKGRRTFTMRNVPGEGDCMFMAVALATMTSVGLGGNDAFLRTVASNTRAVVAQVLGCGSGNLHIEGRRIVPVTDLLRSASKGEGLTEEDYLKRLRLSGTEGGLYGGGPELTVLSNVLRRPISIYELHEDELRALAAAPIADNTKGGGEPPRLQTQTPGTGGAVEVPTQCRIKRVGVFGDFFKDPCLSIPDSAVLSGLQPGAYSWHLRILVVEANPGEKHACVLLPDFCDEA